MKIVVTGATGVLGSYVSNFFFKKEKYKLFKLGFKKKTQYNVDLASNKKLLTILSHIQPEVIINCAGFTDVDFCEENFTYGFKNNVTIVKSLVSVIAKLKKKPHFIHFSTDQVYNSSVGIKNSENNIKLTNNYSVIKYISELEAKKFKNTTILRTNFFGKSYLHDRKTFSGYIALFLKKGKYLKLPKNIYYNPINLKILCELIELIIINKGYGIFNIGSKNIISKLKFGKMIANKLKLKKKLIKKYHSVYSIHKRPLNTTMSVTKVEKFLNVNLKSMEDNLAEKEII